MTVFKVTPGPVCGKCEQQMLWVAEHIVKKEPMQVFHCETCDRYAAAPLTRNNNAAPSVASASLVTGL